MTSMATTAPARAVAVEVEALEVDLVLEGIYRGYGLDFRNYARESVRRRLLRRAQGEGVASISALQERVLHDPRCMARLLADLSVNVTSMFRDPAFYQTFRARVVPQLATYPFIRIWSAGCSTGEEAYSIAIVMREAGLYERTRIYATDINGDVLEHARRGEFTIEKMKDYTANYIAAGGSRSFSEYYTAGSDTVRFDPTLADNMVFARHNLVSDRSFNEFNVILCRNVLIYFAPSLQDEVNRLLYESLAIFGVLGLGRRESLKSPGLERRYERLDPVERLYRRTT
ncbi:MAG: chemotaxis protein methyltransferase CheR [Actinomycetota bacterium]|nr:chemotaxis protein methyltransferase CheR [Actinomycetota bacterium]